MLIVRLHLLESDHDRCSVARIKHDFSALGSVLAMFVEFERSMKKQIGPSTRFFVHNFGRLRTWSDLPLSLIHISEPTRPY